MSSATKTFRGKSVEELIPKIRAELGEDAIVLRRRDGLVGGVGGFFQRRFVEIEATAAAAEGAAPGIDILDDEPALPDYAAPDLIGSFEAELAKAQPIHSPPAARVDVDEFAGIADELAAAGLSSELADGLVAYAKQHLTPFTATGSARALVRRALETRIAVDVPAAPVVAFVGARGSGRSSCAARLATAYALRSELAVVAVAYRTDAEPLRTALDGIDVRVIATETATETLSAIAEYRDDALVVIDTPPAPTDAAELASFAGQLERIGAEAHVTVPATLSRRSLSAVVERLAAFTAPRLALTRADETGHLGPVVDLAAANGLSFSYLAAADDLEPADPMRIAESVLP